MSILMLTYNRAHYLPAAVGSVLAQTYANWELIIIDDGSTDDTRTVVSQFADTRIRYIRHEQNAGLFVRRKESLDIANGTYVAILDSDDIWHSLEKLSMQVSFLEAHPDHVLVGTFCNLIDSSGNNIGKDRYGTSDAEIRRRILFRNQFIHSSALMQKDALDETNGYRATLAEDLDLFLQLGNRGKFANIPEYLTSHRIHGESANDRGPKMARAIHHIIQKHRYEYPCFHLAIVKSYMRNLLAHIL